MLRGAASAENAVGQRLEQNHQAAPRARRRRHRPADDLRSGAGETGIGRFQFGAGAGSCATFVASLTRVCANFQHPYDVKDSEPRERAHEKAGTDARSPICRRVPPRPDLFAPPAQTRAELHPGRRRDAGARHRRQYRHLRPGGCGPAAAAAISRSRSAGHGVGANRALAANRDVAPQHDGLERAEPHLRVDRRVRAEHRRHGDERPRRHRRNDHAPVGLGGVFRRPRRQGDCRPDLSSRRPRGAVERRGHERVALAHAVRCRSRHRRPRPEAGRRAIHCGRHRAAGFSAAGTDELMGTVGVRSAPAAARRLSVPRHRTPGAGRHHRRRPRRDGDNRRRTGA